jgi:hypothetical protein
MAVKPDDDGRPLIRIYRADFRGPSDEIPSRLAGGPKVASGFSVDELREDLRAMAAALNRPLLRWAAFKPDGVEGEPFAFYCPECNALTFGAEPVLRCPRTHPEGP